MRAHALLPALVVVFFIFAAGLISRSESTETKSQKFLLPEKHTSPLSPSQQNGRSLFLFYCAICHGETGRGNGFNSFSLSVKPANFADPARMSKRTDTQIQMVIKQGGAALGLSPLMPVWGNVFSDSQVTDITAYVRTFTRSQ